MTSDHQISAEEIKLLKDRLLEMGRKSLNIINLTSMDKNDIWERAIEINYLGQELFKKLSRLEKVNKDS